jgi:methionyl-tRNA formyltransferase
MVTPPLRIVYFGTPGFAVPTLRALIGSRHDVVGLVSQPDRPKGRGQRLVATPTKEVAVAAGLPVLQPERLRDDAFLAQVRDLRPDLGVVAAYGRLLPDLLLAVPRLGMINVHASLLPRWRGAAPIHRAVIAGDAVTGVTIMRVVKALDAGATFAARRRAIGPDETSVEVEAALASLGADLLLAVVEQMAAGTATETPQDESAVTYADKITRDEGAVEWTLPARRIHDLVRGLQPWPLVRASLGDARVLVHRTELTGEATTAPAATVIRAEGDRIEIAAGDRQVIRVTVLQPEGRRAMTAREYLAGRAVRPGAAVTPA